MQHVVAVIGALVAAVASLWICGRILPTVPEQPGSRSVAALADQWPRMRRGLAMVVLPLVASAAAVLPAAPAPGLVGLAGGFGAALWWIDLRTHRLPTRMVAALGWAVVAVLGGAVVGGAPVTALARAAAVGVAARVVLGGLRLLSGGRFGGGDVRLGAVLAGMLGWYAAGAAALALYLAFVVGGLVALAGLVLRRLDRRAPLPFGPALVGCSWVVLVAVARAAAV